MSPETPANKRAALAAAVQRFGIHADAATRLTAAMADSPQTLREIRDLVERGMKVEEIAETYMDWLEPGWR